MARLVRRKCPCLRPKMEEEVRVLDYRHSSLTDVPSEVFNCERTLEELYADSNQIRDLPRELFYCHGLRKLSISDNEITSIPPAVAGLDYLEELDFSKNGIIDVPDNIKCCKYLRVIDASVNPLGKLPDGFTQLQNLTHLYLNDTFLDYLPGSFGRLVKLKIVEMRENHLKTLPKSFGRLTELERLDIGNNEFTELPDVVGSLSKLLELWCDNNQITSLTHTLGGLKQLIFLDASKNQLTSLPGEIEGCTSLADLHLTSNHLRSLPHTLGTLSSLTTLKVDDNQMTSLPSSLGGLTSLSELNVSVNDLEELPSSIGLLRNLRTFYADDNLLTFVPAELGSCSGITVLSLRSNKLTYVPDEIGRIPRLRVLNLSDNQLSYLPFTIVKLKELQALWLTENQTRPLIPLQSDYEPDTGRKILTCYLLPQGLHSPHDEGGGDGDSDSFHASMWEEQRLQRQQIHFSFDDDDEDEQGHLVRCPTPYPKEMREKSRHMRNLALRQSVSDSTQQPSRSPQSHNVRTQGRTSSLTNDEDDVTAASEGRPGHPHGPSLQETHRLYRCDKEKQLRDKARMHHSQSLPTDVAAYASASVPAAPGETVSAPSDTEEGGRVAGRRKSTPNLFSFEGRASDGKQPRRMPSFTYEDLYQKQILRKHHHRGRRSRRMREYDSDTGYRSDREVSVGRRHNGDLTDDLSVRSQPTLSRCHHRQGREGAGYTSDLEAYAGRGRGGGGGFGRGSNRSSTAPSPKPRTIPPQSYAVSGASQDLRSQSSAADRAPSHHVSTPFRPQSCLTVPTFRPDFSSSPHQQHGSASPAPSQGSSAGVQDCHSPQRISQPPEDSQSSCDQDSGGRHCRSALECREGDLQTDVLAALPERHKHSQKPVPATRRSPTVRQTPPPYQPAPPYRRPSDRGSERSDSSSGVPRSPRDSDLGSSSFSNPDYRAVQGGDHTEEEAPGVHTLGDVFATSHDAAQYKASGGAVLYGDKHSDVFDACVERKYSDDVGSDGAFSVNRQYREPGATITTTGGGGGGFPSDRQYREGGGGGGDGDDPHASSDRHHHYQSPATLQDRTDNQHTPLPPGGGGHSAHYRTPHQAFRHTAQTPHSYSYGQGGSSSPLGRQGDSAWQGGGSSSSSSVSARAGSTREGGRVGAQWSKTTYLDSGGEEGVPSRSDCGPPSGQNSVYGVSSGGRGPGSFYAAVQSRPLSGGGGGGGSSSRTPSAYLDRLRDNLAPVRDQHSHSERTHSPQLHSQSSHLQSQSPHLHSQSPHLPSQPTHLHSQSPHLPSQSPHLPSHLTHLPHTSTTTTFQTRTGSRENVLQGQAVSGGMPQAASPRSSCQRTLEAYPRTLEAYPNPYGEPLEVGDPLMRRYEDVALFKSMQDPSQVSSSTDSGYGHGHHVYERIGDLTAKRSGSPYSSTPSHRGTPVRRSSSSQGTVSREATPVREESFDPVPGPAVSHLPTQYSRDVFRTVLQKKPGLGFSIAGGMGCQDLNPFRTGDSGIFVTKVQAEGPAATLLQPGDKLLQVNHVDFTNIDHTSAVNVLKTSSSVDLLVERVQKINMV